MKSKSTKIHWREVKTARKIEGAKPVVQVGNRYVYDSKTIFWNTFDSHAALNYLSDVAERQDIVKV